MTTQQDQELAALRERLARLDGVGVIESSLHGVGTYSAVARDAIALAARPLAPQDEKRGREREGAKSDAAVVIGAAVPLLTAAQIAEAVYKELATWKAGPNARFVGPWLHCESEFLPANVLCDYAGQRGFINKLAEAIVVAQNAGAATRTTTEAPNAAEAQTETRKP